MKKTTATAIVTSATMTTITPPAMVPALVGLLPVLPRVVGVRGGVVDVGSAGSKQSIYT